jgi:hypothetical protein
MKLCQTVRSSYQIRLQRWEAGAANSTLQLLTTRETPSRCFLNASLERSATGFGEEGRGPQKFVPSGKSVGFDWRK